MWSQAVSDAGESDADLLLAYAREAGRPLVAVTMRDSTGPAKREREERVTRLGRWAVLLGWVSYSLSFFYFLFQTKLNLFEFKFGFEYKPHSIK